MGIDADVLTPMASTVKVALAIEVLSQVAAGGLNPDTMVNVAPWHLRPGHGLITPRLGASGVSLSVRQLLRLSLVESDNTATDLLFDLVGGPMVVHHRVRDLGIEGMRVDRTILDVMSDRRGMRGVPTGGSFDIDRWKSASRSIPAGALAAAGGVFLADDRDTTTANAMTGLLASIFKGSALSPLHTAELLRLMESCSTGRGRIRAGIPPKAKAAHKTGTLVGLVSADAGIIELPGGDHIALAIFVVGSSASTAEQDRMIADLTSAACSYF